MIFPLRRINIVCTLVLLDDGGRALLQLRDRKAGLSASGLWVFPGGHAEPDESIDDCVKREFQEETAYATEAPRWLLTVDDAFICKPAVTLEVFWDRYIPGRPFLCREGQSLEFVERERAYEILMPEYLIPIWDLALFAKSAEDVK